MWNYKDSSDQNLQNDKSTLAANIVLLITDSGTVYMRVEPSAKTRGNRVLYIFLLAAAAVAFGVIAVSLWFFS